MLCLGSMHRIQGQKLKMLIDDLDERISNGIRFLPVGWLSAEKYSRAVSVNDIDRMKSYINRAEDLGAVIDRFRSSRTCPVCADLKTIKSTGIIVGFQNLVLQSSFKGAYWFFPDLIVHHMEAHGYEPPEFFMGDLNKNFEPIADEGNVKSSISPFWVSERRFSPVPTCF